MPIPILLKKAAGSIKRDRKDVRAVMTVNESQAPALTLRQKEYRDSAGYARGYAPGKINNPYSLNNKDAQDLHDLLKETDRDLGFDQFVSEGFQVKPTKNIRTKGFQNPTNLEFYHRNVLSYINPEEVPKYTYDQTGKDFSWPWHDTPPIAKFYIQVVQNARKPDGTWNLKKLEKAALDAYNSRNAPLDSNPGKYVRFSSKWGYETLKLLQNPKEFNENGYDEKNYDLVKPPHVSSLISRLLENTAKNTTINNPKDVAKFIRLMDDRDYKQLGGHVKPKNRINTPSKYTPLELNNMHLYSNGRRDMLAPFNDRYPFEPKKPNPYLQNNLNAEKNEVGNSE